MHPPVSEHLFVHLTQISSSFPFSRLLAREAQCWLEEADSGPQVSQLSCTLPPTTVPSDNEILRLEMTLDVQRMSSLCLLESFRIALSSVSSSDGHPARLLLGPDESTDTNVAVNRTVPIAVGSAATLLLVFLLALCLYSALSSSSKKKHTKSEGAIEGKVSPVVNDGNPAIPQDVLDDSHGVVGDGVLTLKPQHSAIASVDDAIAAPRRPSVANDVLQELLQPLPSAHSSIVHVQGKRRRRRSQHAHHIGTGTTQLEGRDQCDTRVTSTRPREPSELIPAVDELSESNPLNPAVVDLDVNVKCAKGKLPHIVISSCWTEPMFSLF